MPNLGYLLSTKWIVKIFARLIRIGWMILDDGE